MPRFCSDSGTENAHEMEDAAAKVQILTGLSAGLVGMDDFEAYLI